MKVRTPKHYASLPSSQRKRIEEYCRNVAFEAARETTERDGRIMFDIYIKFTCKLLHDTFGYGEKRLYLFLGQHKRLFKEQVEMVKNGTQVEYLNGEMAKIFRKSGFPEDFFNDMLGPVETVEEVNA
jgi:hypothetical protein